MLLFALTLGGKLDFIPSWGCVEDLSELFLLSKGMYDASSLETRRQMSC